MLNNHKTLHSLPNSPRDTKTVLQVKCDSLACKLENKLKRVARVATEETQSQSSATRRVAVEEAQSQPSAVRQYQSSQVKLFIRVMQTCCKYINMGAAEKTFFYPYAAENYYLDNYRNNNIFTN